MSTLKVHMTYGCTARCDHCRFGCSRWSGPVIEYDLVIECVDALQELNHLERVVLMGGEPGLVPELTHRLATAIRRRGVAVNVETNASWATDDEAARRFLEPLYAQGAAVMLSLDIWHERFVPPARVARAARMSEALGGEYFVEAEYLDAVSCSHEQDKRTNALLDDLERQLGKRPRIYQGTILYNGRASEKLAPLVASGRGVPSQICDRVPWWYDSQLETLELLILDPDGYLSKGCGIAIANVHQTPIDEVLVTYDAARHPIFSTLLQTGPRGLAREAEALGYVLKADYADRCHLCQEARQVLLRKYPEYLVPEQHYRQDDSERPGTLTEIPHLSVSHASRENMPPPK
jgi:organic radical activating enzyme